MLRAQGASGPGAWLLEAQPATVVGHAYYIFDIPPDRGTPP